jgi:hypothetical protein
MVVHCPSSGQFFNIIARAGLGSRAGLAGGHADEILVTVPGSFIASQDEQGIGWFLSRRRG